MKKAMFIFGAVLVVELLTGCNRGMQNSPQNMNDLSQTKPGPVTSKAVIVRVDTNNPSTAQFLNLDAAPAKENFAQFANVDHNWQNVDSSKVISGTQGYPSATQGSYFVQQPKDFIAPSASSSIITAGYIRGRGNYGYCNYPNYYGYGNGLYNHYYPSSFGNYGFNYGNYSYYNYLPTYYSNYSYWYYQPTYYYPYYNNYNYYVYSTWW